MSSDWWARKLGGQPARPAQPQAAPSYPQGPPPPQYAQPLPQGTEPHVAPDGSNFTQVAGQWKGGKATKTETMACPNCGGDHYFSQTNVNPLAGGAGGATARIMTERGAATTSPRCFDCGYNSAFGLQTGSM